MVHAQNVTKNRKFGRRATSLFQNVAGVSYVDEGPEDIGRHGPGGIIEHNIVGCWECIAKRYGGDQHFDANEEILDSS